ncbi:arginine--tRNA ligase [Texas Phoenix palm phytoplasma]|uniref:Arginine--tRNA ligase n=1 Tax=Texas Phoenix palm phytoplasma TaxID=176709 RepID=A0ABS5BI02_9MOLU|nr:arginine--tRNA ligase [Texas Phoenix palm phytoplasma]MBP3059212.1 arginine--tRNA ligase [Texas Phoenix palm phytoplasma]
MYFEIIQEKIKRILESKYDINISLRQNRKDDSFDLCLPLFPYKNKFKISFLQIFEKLKKEIVSLKEIEDIFFINGFLNIKLKKKNINKEILMNVLKLNSNYGQKKENNKVIILDYSSPNIAKNFSIGHLRSTVIGNALKNIYKKLGFRTISINHLGDWGTQFGKMILAYQKWGKKEELIINPIDQLQKLYIRFHEEAMKNDFLNQEARKVFNELENQENDVIKLWKWFKDISLIEFQKIYNLLGINFDYYIGESFFHNKAIELLKHLKKQNLLILDKKAYIFPLGNDCVPALIQKENGSTLYLTRDIACAIYRYEKFNFHKCLYVVGNEQKLHYQQMKKILSKMGFNFKLEHINFGLVLAQNIKISTRTNNDYKLIDIIEKASCQIQDKIIQKNPNLKNLKEISNKIAIGAIVFNDLKNDRHLDIEFNLKQMLQLEGHTGPYLQYTVVRLESIFKKNPISLNKINSLIWDNISIYFQKSSYFVLIKMIDQFDDILEKSKIKNMPSILARFLIILAKKVNQFYSKNKILAENENLKYSNLILIKSVVIVLKEGLNILGIPILEKM